MFGNDTQNLFEGLLDLINKWKPEHYSNEKDYQKALYEYLLDLQDRGQIKEERKILRERGESNIDIQVDGVGIEVGMNLKHQPEVDRKTTQIKRHLRNFDYVIVVFVGENSRQHVTLFKHEIKDFQSDGDIMGGNEKVVRIIEIKDRNGGENRRPTEDDDGGDDHGDGGLFGGFKMPEIKLPEIKMPDFRF